MKYFFILKNRVLLWSAGFRFFVEAEKQRSSLEIKGKVDALA